MAFITSDPKIISLAFLSGIIPSLLWLWFWLREDNHPEPKGLLVITFIMGMLSVMIVLPIQKFIQEATGDANIQLVLWAAAEEIIKFIAVFIVIHGTNQADEPVDWPIYLITVALGFAALENALFLLKPIAVNGATIGFLTGQLRFLGSTLLHTISSGVIGISMGLSYFMEAWKKKWFLFIGFLVSISLHAAFNFFIMNDNGIHFLKVFAFLWVVTIIVMLLFEKIRRIGENYN